MYMLEAIDEIVDIVDGPQLMTPVHLARAFKEFKSVFGNYEERRKERLERKEVGGGGSWRGLSDVITRQNRNCF
jgi:hypothetical protein